MVDVDRLANICRNELTTPTHHAPPPFPCICLGYFSVNLVGVAKGILEMEQPSVLDTIPELYEMSPKINYFDLAFKVSCFLHREIQHASAIDCRANVLIGIFFKTLIVFLFIHVK